MTMSHFVFSSRRRHTRFDCDWSSDVCSSDLTGQHDLDHRHVHEEGVYWLAVVMAVAVASAVLSHEDQRQCSLPAEHITHRTEERRVGEECRSRWATEH